MPQHYSPEYIRLSEQGPFHGQIDPFAEVGRYFHQIHAGIISQLIDQIKRPLLELGYYVGRETSLQIAELQQPDIYVQQRDNPQPASSGNQWDYRTAAQAINAQAGVHIDWDINQLQGISIKTLADHQLVTIIEVISPSNIANTSTMLDYQERRERLIENQINVMEIDLTRSVRRLLDNKLLHTYPYHVAIYLPDDSPRLIGIHPGECLPRVALPLRQEVIPMELHTAYEYAYQSVSIAVQIDAEGRYTEASLPFPSLIPPEILKSAIKAVDTWHTELSLLHKSTNPKHDDD